MKSSLITTVAAVLTLFLGVSAQGELLNVTTLDVPGASSTQARGIDGGNIVGYYNDGSGGYHGFIYDGMNYTTLDVPGAIETYAYGINGGYIVGRHTDNVGSKYHAFSYDGQDYTPFDVPEAFFTSAYDVAVNVYPYSGMVTSHIVGFYRETNMSSHGFTCASSHGVHCAGSVTFDVPGATSTRVRGIDGSTIVGYYNDASSDTRGFSYDGTTYTTIDVPGATKTYVYGIDGDNIVGYYSVIVKGTENSIMPSYETHGFSHDGTTYTTLDVPGATKTHVYGIDGDNIVGAYYDTDGNTHGFIATIPEPATLSLLALGLLLAWRRR